MRFFSCLSIIPLIFAASLQGENISGTVLIKRKLTKHSVTATISVYQRGPVVDLGKEPEQDPLSYERSRVAVWIEGPGPSKNEMLSMEQVERRFSPDLLVVSVGSGVSFPNMDPIFHNVFSLSKPRNFDLGNYQKGETRNVKFSTPGLIYVGCHLHANMAGVIVVTPNRWNAKADGSGHFQLRDVPPGQYTVVAWHKAAGYFRRTVNVASGNNTEVEFFIPLEAPEPEKLQARK